MLNPTDLQLETKREVRKIKAAGKGGNLYTLCLKVVLKNKYLPFLKGRAIIAINAPIVLFVI